ncbi:hypothetical protein BBK36DRAFT_8845 [Trichoderma citrinoviride]|uniref:Uncharacterized protein n=1 Tax=Trichoderma citrinoviride TaxID=58853 RepID=A0A2T4AY33_9HYPO|nr:hypothetical protein BBK36DRAFT_8845 [Trichoderma citrinoviride]PTB61963.1 hypothetical protein BBK36DRAFT_8845 [Trichoderma citrinoviride]
MRSGRKPTLGDQIADAYMGAVINPDRTRRPRIPEIRVASPSGAVTRVTEICHFSFDGPLEKERRETLRESLAELEERRRERAARNRSRNQPCLADQPEKQPLETKPAENEKAPAEEKPPQKEEAPEPKKVPKAEAPQASSGPVRKGTFRALLTFGRHFMPSSRASSRGWRQSLMG